MSQKELIEAISQQAHHKTDEILEEAKRQASIIVRKSEDELDKIKENILRRARSSVKSEEAKIINEARLHAKKEQLVAKHEVIEKVMNGLEEKIAELPGKNEYSKIFSLLLQESLDGASGKAKIKCRNEDVALIEKFVSGKNIQVELEKAPSGFSGVDVVWGEEYQFIRKNSFNSRLEKIYPELLKEANKLIFHEQKK